MPGSAEDAHAGLVLLAHGSRSPDTAKFYDALLVRLTARAPERRIAYAFLEGFQPTLAEAAARLVAEGARRILVIPMLLAPGRHLERDVPELLARVRAAHPGVVVEHTELPSESPLFVELLLAARAL